MKFMKLRKTKTDERMVTGKMYHSFRLMAISPFYPCGKPCSRGTDNETVKTWPYFLQSSMEL